MHPRFIQAAAGWHRQADRPTEQTILLCIRLRPFDSLLLGQTIDTAVESRSESHHDATGAKRFFKNEVEIMYRGRPNVM